MIGKTSAGTSAKEEKTVTAGTAQKVVTPSNGKLLSKVTINPTPSQAKTATPTAAQQTIKPDSGKLLSQVLVNAVPDSEKKGLYVWKKYQYTPAETVTNPSFTYNITNEGTKTFSEEQRVFLNYVVSDAETAYPDNGLQNGYWYEKVVEGKAGVDIVFFTPTEDVLTATVAHTLGKMPSNVAVCRVKGNSSDYSANHVLCAADTAVSAYNNNKYYGAAYSYSSASGITSNELSFTENLIAYASKYYRLEAGVTYAFIAIG